MIQTDKLADWFPLLIEQYKRDSSSVYNTWFKDDLRLKSFRAIRKGVETVVKEIKKGTFGNNFKGSSLEVVLSSICEQKQVFAGANHAFIWKPKLRIPDIYENEKNKRAFGMFLESFLQGKKEEVLVGEIKKLSHLQIKGLGPAVANILYFLHPTWFPPFNTAMVQGFNACFQQKIKLGSWTDYMMMRETILEINREFQPLLSIDLGVISGLLFQVGSGKTLLPKESGIQLSLDEKKLEKFLRKWEEEVKKEHQEENEHIEQQFLLAKLGKSLGYDVWIASNDRGKMYQGEKLSFHTLDKFPMSALPKEVIDSTRLIDVIWFEKDSPRVVSAFEVERTTSIYSGILRMMDLASSLEHPDFLIYLVVPKTREKDVRLQLNRPSFQGIENLHLQFIFFEDLCEYCDAMCKLGSDISILSKVTHK